MRKLLVVSAIVSLLIVSCVALGKTPISSDSLDSAPSIPMCRSL